MRSDLGIVATNVVHHAVPAGRRLASVLASVRAGRPLDELEGWLPAAGAAYLRSGAEQARRFARYPGAVEHAFELGRACAFDLHLVAPRLPDFPVPAGHSEMTFLRQLVEEGATRRYGSPGTERVPGAWRQLEHELAMIDELGFAGYFLVVWDIARVCKRLDIYCQGRGSAAWPGPSPPRPSGPATVSPRRTSPVSPTGRGRCCGIWPARCPTRAGRPARGGRAGA